MIPLQTIGRKFGHELPQLARPALLALFLLLPGPPDALAAQTSEPSASVTTAITRLHEDLAGDQTLEDARRQALAETLERAKADDALAETEIGRARDLASGADALPARIDALEETLRDDPSELFRRWRETLDADADSPTLALQAADLEAAATNLSERITDTAEQLALADQRPAIIARELDQARRDVDALAGRVATPAGATIAQRVDALAAQASQRLLLARIQALNAERSTLPARSRLVELEQRSLQRQAVLVRRQSDVIASLLADSTDAELDALDTRLRGEADDNGEHSPVLAAEAERNLALGRELSSTEAASRQAGEQLRSVRARSEETAEALRNTQTRLALQSHDDAVGLILLNERRRSDDPQQVRQDLSQVHRKLAQVQLRLIELDEQAAALTSPSGIATARLHGDEDDSATPDPLVSERLVALLTTRAELVARLAATEREYLRVLNELEAALTRHLETSLALTELLDRELLWFPSHEPIDLAWIKRQPQGWADLLKPSRFVTASRLLGNTMKARWPLLLVMGALLVALLRQRARLREQLHALAQPLMRVRTDSYSSTLQAVTLTGLTALALPLPLALAGWLLREGGESGRFSDSLGKALLATAGGLLLHQALRWLIVEDGLAHKHFRWMRTRRDAIHAALPWFLYGVLPAQFLLILAFARGQEPALDTTGRLTLLAICAAVALMSWRLFAPGALWTFRGISESEPSQARRALRFGLLGAMLGIAVLALRGYLLTAAALLHGLWLSLLLFTTLAIVHGLVSRWFLLGERRLALRRIEARHEVEDAQTAQRDGPGAPGETPAADPENEALSIQHVSLQTRRLLRALMVGLTVAGLTWVWSSMLPALDRLNMIVLWNISELDASGTASLSPVTLAAVLAGLLVLILTAAAARNLPGLVELSLLSRIHVDAGARYAISSVSRYMIVIIGTIIGLSLLGVRWSQLQWLAAALTVGLGFGLQEIFANFVSGLIVLFERPYRVGDTITIGEVEGRVTRIRTRATTLVDADNREVVVPNKTFITSRFVNWTLSDTVTRVVFKLGLAQDADPQQVHDLLLRLARSEPLVLQQPAPGCWFTQITSGSYDFELRVHVAELSQRTRVRDSLNRRIAAALDEAGLATSRPGLTRIRMEPAD